MKCAAFEFLPHPPNPFVLLSPLVRLWLPCGFRRSRYENLESGLLDGLGNRRTWADILELGPPPFLLISKSNSSPDTGDLAEAYIRTALSFR